MMREKPERDWGGEGLLKEVLDSSALDEPSGKDLTRLRKRLAGMSVGIAATAAVTDAAASAGAVGGAVTAAAGKSALGLGVVVKVTSAVVIAATVTVGTIHLTTEPPVHQEAGESMQTREKPKSDLYEVRPLLSKDDRAAFNGLPLAERQPQALVSQPSVSPQPPDAPRQKPTTLSVAEQTRIEAQLLERARNILNRSPKKAFDLASSHQRRFPTGLLSEEREVIVISALKRLGRERDACDRAARFISSHPKSTVRAELEKLCQTNAHHHR